MKYLQLVSDTCRYLMLNHSDWDLHDNKNKKNPTAKCETDFQVRVGTLFAGCAIQW